MRYLKLITVSCLFLLAVSLTASAGSINDSFSNSALVGVSGTASGGFTFNTTTDKFSNLSVSFNGGYFGGIHANDGSGGQGTCFLNLCGFAWQTNVGGNTVWNTIVLNIQTGQYQDFGGIYDWKNQGSFNYLSVAEGSTELAYLMLSAVAILGGILIAGKQRRRLMN